MGSKKKNVCFLMEVVVITPKNIINPIHHFFLFAVIMGSVIMGYDNKGYYTYGEIGDKKFT